MTRWQRFSTALGHGFSDGWRAATAAFVVLMLAAWLEAGPFAAGGCSAGMYVRVLWKREVARLRRAA